MKKRFSWIMILVLVTLSGCASKPQETVQNKEEQLPTQSTITRHTLSERENRIVTSLTNKNYVYYDYSLSEPSDHVRFNIYRLKKQPEPMKWEPIDSVTLDIAEPSGSFMIEYGLLNTCSISAVTEHESQRHSKDDREGFVVADQDVLEKSEVKKGEELPIIVQKDGAAGLSTKLELFYKTDHVTLEDPDSFYAMTVTFE